MIHHKDIESVYKECLCYELAGNKIPFQRQLSVPLLYRGVSLNCDYRLDILIDRLVIAELKAVERVERIHEVQLLTYLRLQKLWLGLLINFNVTILRNGIRRLVNG